MNQLKFIALFWGCLLLVGCTVSEEKKAVIDRLTQGDSKIKRSDIKFIKFTPVDENFACYTVSTGNGSSDLQLPMRKQQNKWVVGEVMGGSHGKCIEIVKLKAHEVKEEPDAQKAVLHRLKDPDSAKFGSFTLIDDSNACLSVNARNSYGGYTGQQEAWLTKLGGEWQVLDIKEDKNYATCVGIMRKISEKKAANVLKRQGAGHTGKVLRVHKVRDSSYTYAEVESNGEKLLIGQLPKPIDFKAGDIIEVPDTLPTSNYVDELKKKFPEVIMMQYEKVKVVK
jgi:hypothetical protein